MAKLKDTTATFERFALTAAIREHPGDETAARALVDHLEEAGYTNMGARREVKRIVREATDEALAVLVNRNLTRSPTYRRMVATEVYTTLPPGRDRQFSIVAVPGGAGPAWEPADCRWINADGSEWTEERSPHAYLDPGVRWVPRVWVCKVGAAWIAQRVVPLPSSSATPTG